METNWVEPSQFCGSMQIEMVIVLTNGLGRKASFKVEAERCNACHIEFHKNPPFAPSSWLRIVYEALRRLHNESTRPHRKYFHYKRDICSYIDKNWPNLCPMKKRE